MAKWLLKIGALMAPGTPGQEAILPALTRTHMGDAAKEMLRFFRGHVLTSRAVKAQEPERS
jgi:hypothetical protein